MLLTEPCIFGYTKSNNSDSHSEDAELEAATGIPWFVSNRFHFLSHYSRLQVEGIRYSGNWEHETGIQRAVPSVYAPTRHRARLRRANF